MALAEYPAEVAVALSIDCCARITALTMALTGMDEPLAELLDENAYSLDRIRGNRTTRVSWSDLRRMAIADMTECIKVLEQVEKVEQPR